MRIAVISEGYLPELSGVTLSLQERVKWLANWGHQIRIYAPDYAPLVHLYPNYQVYVGQVMPGVTVVPFASRPYYVEHTRDPRPFSFGRVAADIAAFAPDVIHAECPARLFMGFYARPGVRLARKLGVPVTAFYHTNYLAYTEDYRERIAWLRIPGITRALQKMIVWVYNSFDVTMVPARVTRDYLAAQGVDNIRQGPFIGVDPEQFRPVTAPLPPQIDALADRVKLIYVGRMTPDKQIDLLLRALDLVRRETTSCGFMLVGGGEEEAKIRSWAEGREDVVVTGRLSHHETAPYYAAADVFVTASPKENFPLTILEAMACGLPVVGPAAGGVSELTEQGQTGLLVPPNDAEALAESIRHLVDDPTLRKRMGARARQKARTHTWENGAKHMLNLWEELTRR